MNAEFPSTHKSLLNQLRSTDPGRQRTALEIFVKGYRQALIHFLVAGKGVNRDSAEDLVQDFVLNKIMSGRILDSYENKGNFRNLLRKSLQNYLIDEFRKEKVRQTNVQSNSVLLGLGSIKKDFDSFDRMWAIGVFTSVLKRMQTSSPYWGVFLSRVLTVPPLPYGEVVKRHGFEDPIKASNALMTAKRTFHRLLEESIADGATEGDAGGFDEDLRLLRQVLFDADTLSSVLQSLEEIRFEGVEDLAESSVGDLTPSGIQLLAQNQGDWSVDDLKSVLDHLLEQPVSRYLTPPRSAAEPDRTLRIKELVVDGAHADESSLEKIKRLKNYFKAPAQEGSEASVLPREIIVTVVFLLIGSFVSKGGVRVEITTIEPTELAQSLESIAAKPWVERELADVLRAAIGLL